MERRRRGLSLRKPFGLKQSSITGFVKQDVTEACKKEISTSKANKPLGVVSPMTTTNPHIGSTATSIPSDTDKQKKTKTTPEADIGFPDSMFLGELFNDDDDDFDFSFNDTKTRKVSPKMKMNESIIIDEDSNEMIPPTCFPPSTKTNTRRSRRGQVITSDSEEEIEIEDDNTQEKENQQEQNYNFDDNHLEYQFDEKVFHQDDEFIDPPPPSPPPEDFDLDEYLTMPNKEHSEASLETEPISASSENCLNSPDIDIPIAPNPVTPVVPQTDIHEDSKIQQGVESPLPCIIGRTSSEDEMEVDIQSISTHPYLSPLPKDLTLELLNVRISGLKGLLIEVMDKVCCSIEKTNTVSQSVRKAIIFRKRIKAAIKRAENRLETLPKTASKKDNSSFINENDEFNMLLNDNLLDSGMDVRLRTSIGSTNLRDNLSNTAERCMSTPIPLTRTNPFKNAIATPPIEPIPKHFTSPLAQSFPNVEKSTTSLSGDKVVTSSGFKFKKISSKTSTPSGLSSGSPKGYKFSSCTSTFKQIEKPESNKNISNSSDVPTLISTKPSSVVQSSNSAVQRKSMGYSFENSFETEQNLAPQTGSRNSFISGFGQSNNNGISDFGTSSNKFSSGGATLNNKRSFEFKTSNSNHNSGIDQSYNNRNSEFGQSNNNRNSELGSSSNNSGFGQSISDRNCEFGTSNNSHNSGFGTSNNSVFGSSNNTFSLPSNFSERPAANKFGKKNEPKKAESWQSNKPATKSTSNQSLISKYSGFNFPHSNEMMKVFRKVFGLREFRCNQLEAVNAALMGEDCFVLMPTGGGKSLTYQLPGVISSGVTIVVSPLKSLIQDQVQRLVSLGIPATHLSGELNLSSMDNVYRELSLREPILKLLYVTPEKISNSNKLQSTFENLYRRGMLARFVIDEVHCVSQWGHDFRPDYIRLCNLRKKFPGVPMMGLTATATPRVRADILKQLNMKNPQWFTQSFDRSNLRYTVVKKRPSKATEEILQMIKKQFPRMSGIVYCLSRNECEKVARDLSDGGVNSKPYHAGQSDTVRTKVHEDWLNDKVKVVCATIAFGMGIDKPDVRFVFHYSLPKSVEGYYQESGRAGRDGKTAHCILFYMYKDVVRMRKLLEGQSANRDAQKTHLDNLYRMVQYCENETDCRRMQLLQYFGENDYSREKCRSKPETVCGNCESQIEYKAQDMTQHAKGIVEFARELEQASGPKRGRWPGGNQYTLIHFIEVYKGSVSAKVTNVGHDKCKIHALGKSLSKSDCERFIRKLVIDGYLREDMQFTALDHTVCYIKVGPKANALMTGRARVEMNIQCNSKPAKSSIISSPVISETQKLKQNLYNELRDTCKRLGRQTGMNPDNIFNAQSLLEISEKLPLTNEEMLCCTGVTEAKLVRFGQEFLEVIYKFQPQFEKLKEDDFEFENTSVQSNNSHYFDSDTTKKRQQTKRKRAPRTTTNKRMRSVDNATASNHKNANTGWVSKSSYNNNSNKGTLSKKFAFKTKGNATAGPLKLNLMPNPQPRSFLSSVNRI
ncbi:uncharacterized protein [Antedon mediterranea]|uniref:uncharacterized protein n=1 Tax=Antedon mediterranea TaxID=105859 RepID=UPI003AF78A7B